MFFFLYETTTNKIMDTIRLQRDLEKLILLFIATVKTYFVCSLASRDHAVSA